MSILDSPILTLGSTGKYLSTRIDDEVDRNLERGFNEALQVYTVIVYWLDWSVFEIAYDIATILHKHYCTRTMQLKKTPRSLV